MTTPKQAVTPAHQWTHDGAKVRLLKCVAADGTSYDGFRWPEAGAVICPRAERDRATASAATRDSGGLFGQPWGLGQGTGREPDYAGRWIVFEADPADVVLVSDKAKVIGRAEVIFSGPWWLAWTRVLPGAVAWTRHASSGAASATGWRGAASVTGEGATVEAGVGGICAVNCDEVTWRVHEDAILVQRWHHADADDDVWKTAVFIPRECGYVTGERVRIRKGVAVERQPPTPEPAPSGPTRKDGT